ncbi:MAG: hypothetical protein IKI15_02800 [Lachnospiraceae bacterium]|nr:hypothetical protein [Lachnospiraceae bacterium]
MIDGPKRPAFSAFCEGLRQEMGLRAGKTGEEANQNDNSLFYVFSGILPVFRLFCIIRHCSIGVFEPEGSVGTKLIVV